MHFDSGTLDVRFSIMFLVTMVPEIGILTDLCQYLVFQEN